MVARGTRQMDRNGTAAFDRTEDDLSTTSCAGEYRFTVVLPRAEIALIFAFSPWFPDFCL